jgi:cytochrome c oxidase subunit 2
MIGQIVVMEPADYQAWLGGGPVVPLAVSGQKLFAEMGCITCHRSDAQGRGPNLVGLFGKPVALEDGRTLTADENYIRQCILNSRGQVVKGFPAIMPVFQGLLSEEQVNSLVAYIKSLGAPQPGQTVKTASASTQPEAKVQ